MHVFANLHTKERPLINFAQQRQVEQAKLVESELSLRKLALDHDDALFRLDDDVRLCPAVTVVVPILKPLSMNYLTQRKRPGEELRRSLLEPHSLRGLPLQFLRFR